MRKFLLSSFLLLPAVAFALNYTDATGMYTDGPFSVSEAAGISVLTRLRAVSGNPDGTFAPRRTLNRAEFAKIVTLLVAGRQDIEPESCFPDVHAEDWFSPYVCFQKNIGAIQGNPDGLFHPERPVNYAEAVKILSLAYAYDVSIHEPGEAWYVRYLRAAKNRYTSLPINLEYGALITRGQMARLAAGFAAESAGELDIYRAAERGQIASSSSISSTSSSSTSSFSSPSSTTSTSSASSLSIHDFPARSRFLVAGERSQPVGSATYFARLEAMFVRNVKVTMKNKVSGIDAMWFLDSDGKELGRVYLDKVFDPTEKTWRGFFSGTGTYRIPKDEQRTLGIEVAMKARNQGGTSEEMVQVHNIEITTEGEWSGDPTVSGQVPLPFPKHQTSMGRITEVRNAGESSGILPVGPQQLLGVFSVKGYQVPGVTLRIEQLEFQLSKSPFVGLSNWQLTIPSASEKLNCSMSDNVVSCGNIPESLGTLSDGQATLRLYGDVVVLPGGNDKNLQISLNLAGDLETGGAVRWTDETGHFSWVELETPLARGTLWK